MRGVVTNFGGAVLVNRSCIFSAALSALLGVCATPAAAIDDSGHFTLQIVCLGPSSDVRMEVYVPQSSAYDKDLPTDAKKPVIGYYALDLEKYGKGKPLEPVKLWKDEKAKAVVVDQFTRGLPPTRVPIDGGVVDFDKRFAEGARCKPYANTREDEDGVDFPPAPPGEAEEK